MSKPVVIVPEAENEVREAAAQYEELASGLARGSVSSVRAIENNLSVNPGMYEGVLGPIRRAPVRRFPYGLFYVEEPDQVRVGRVTSARAPVAPGAASVR